MSIIVTLSLINQYLLRGRFNYNVKEGACGHKTGIKLYIYHLIHIHGAIFCFINFEKLNAIGIMANTNLKNQRRVFVDEYARSNNHLESIRKV